MICTTTRKGHDCVFMSAKGCTYTDGTCQEAVEPCEGCARIVEIETGIFCTVCAAPAAKWKIGNCNMATHVKLEGPAEGAKKINPIKASKRL